MMRKRRREGISPDLGDNRMTSKEIQRKVWDRVFGLKRGDKVWLQSIEPKSGEIHYEYCTIVEIRNGRYTIRRNCDGQYSWSDGKNLERIVEEMKVCRKHKKELRRGMTYEIVPQRDCRVCRHIKELIRQYED